VPRGHRETLVGQEEGGDKTPHKRQCLDLRTQGRRHQEVSQVDEQDACDDDRRRSLLGQELNHRELRRSGEDENAHPGNLERLQS